MLITLRLRRNRSHFADDIFKCIFFNENELILIRISLKFISKGPINNIPALVQIMAWRRPGDKPLSEPMMVWLLTHLCIIWPQWVILQWWKYSQGDAYQMEGTWPSVLIFPRATIERYFLGHTSHTNADVFCGEYYVYDKGKVCESTLAVILVIDNKSFHDNGIRMIFIQLMA